MRNLLIIIGILISGHAVSAGTPVANQFTAGDPIVANDVNANFQELANRIDANQTAISGVSSTSTKQLVGFTTATTAGDVGIKALTEMCSTDFPGSRMCTSQEIVETTSFPTLLSGSSAYVRPVLMGTGTGSANHKAAIDVFSGTYAIYSDELTCGGWRLSTRSGLYVDFGLRFTTGLCSSLRSVACCM